MAMNKREQAELETARQSLAAALALGWPCVPRPKSVDLATIRTWSEGSKLYEGWTCHVYRDEFRVRLGCSNGIGHSDDRTDRTTTQGCGQFFASKMDALIEVRWQMCEEAAKGIARIDAAIAAEQKEPS